jgi:hypothetical protein
VDFFNGLFLPIVIGFKIEAPSKRGNEKVVLRIFEQFTAQSIRATGPVVCCMDSKQSAVVQSNNLYPTPLGIPACSRAHPDIKYG